MLKPDCTASLDVDSNARGQWFGGKPDRLRRAKIFSFVGLLSIFSIAHAVAQTCSTTSLPYALANGATADASQVVADLNCAATYGLAQTSSNVGVSAIYPTENLHVAGAQTN